MAAGNPFREGINLDDIVGYRAQRDQLKKAVESESNLIILEGEIGAGKSTVMREAHADSGGIYVNVGTRENTERAIRTHYNLLERVLTRPDEFQWISKPDKRVVLYLDENRLLEPETILELKQATSLNPRLTITIALTPRQTKNLLTDFTEVQRRIQFQNHITLNGLTTQEIHELITKRAPIPFDDTVIESIAQQTRLPLGVLETAAVLFDQATKKNKSRVTPDLIDALDAAAASRQELAQAYSPARASAEAPPGPAPSSLKLMPLEARCLELLKREPGLKRGEIAEKLGTSPNSAGNYLLALTGKFLVQKNSGRYYPYGQLGTGDLGS